MPGGAGIAIVRVHAPSVHAVDGCGAGATFSAGFIYGHLKGWDLERSARFLPRAAASLKVTRPGFANVSDIEIDAFGSSAPCEYPVAAGQPYR